MGLFSKFGKGKSNQPKGMKSVEKIVAKADPVQISDRLEALFSLARWGKSEGEKAKAATEFGLVLAELNDVDLIHAIYEKQPYKEEAVKQLVLQRYFEILNGIADVNELLKYTGDKYSHNFSNNASLRISDLLSQIDDPDVMESIMEDGSGFDHRAKDIAKLKLNHAKMSTAQLKNLINQGSTSQLRALAAGYITDVEALKKLALDLTNTFEVVITAQIKLIQVTDDKVLLEKIKSTANGFASHNGYEHMPTVIAELVDKRAAEISG